MIRKFILLSTVHHEVFVFQAWLGRDILFRTLDLDVRPTGKELIRADFLHIDLDSFVMKLLTVQILEIRLI